MSKIAQNMNKVTIYGDYVSQPFRAVVSFCKMNQIPHTIHEMRLSKKEQMTDKYKKINPVQKVPAIVDGDFNLFESHAILKYLKKSRECPDHWYPNQDIKLRAKVNEYMDWHHVGLRGTSMKYSILRFRELCNDQAQIDSAHNDFRKSLKLIENYWLSSQNKQFLVGDQMTLADLTSACEMAHYLPTQEDFYKDFPKIKAWLGRIMDIPEVKEVHQQIFEVQRRGYARLDSEREEKIKDVGKL
eukprot:403334766